MASDRQAFSSNGFRAHGKETQLKDEQPCLVCKGLPYLVPSKWTDLRESEISRRIVFLPDEVCQKISLPNGGTGIRIMNNYVPPHPNAAEWLLSAKNGCQACQLVVDAADCIRNGWFVDHVSPLSNKYIGAFTIPELPLTVALTDTTFEMYHERVFIFEVFTPPGKQTNRNCLCRKAKL